MSRFPAAFRPPAFASRSPCSRPGPGPSSRSAYRAPPGARTRTGFPRFTPARYDRGGRPLYPGDGGAPPGQMPCPAGACRFPAASPCTPQPHPTSGATLHEASTRVHAIHPSGLPLACGPPDGTEDPWAFPCAPHPAVTGDARQGGAGPRARARNYTTDIIGPPIRESPRKVRPRVATAEECVAEVSGPHELGHCEWAALIPQFLSPADQYRVALGLGAWIPPSWVHSISAQHAIPTKHTPAVRRCRTRWNLRRTRQR